MKLLDATTNRITTGVQRHLPESFVIAVGLIVFIMVMAMVVEGTGPLEVIQLYGGAFWDLLAFSMQIAMLLLTGYILANTPLVDRGLTAVSSRIHDPRFAAAVATFAGALGTWINAGFGLVVGVILARKFAKEIPGLHYPLAVAGGYAGYSLYGIGLSGTIPLTIATPDHILEEEMGLIAHSDTVFHPIVLGTSIVVIFGLPLLVAMLHPKNPKAVVEADPAALVDEVEHTPALPDRIGGLADRLNNSPLIGWFMGLLGLTYTVTYFVGGGVVDFNIINLTFLFLGILLFGRPTDYLACVRVSTKVVSGILIQYPMYAGIMGVLAGSGLMVTMASVFVNFSTPETLPFFSFISGGVINIFAPSGGAQWAIQGPVMIEAAQQMGADPGATAIGVAMGDQWTNAIQPFWILPVLAISGIRLRDVMGYLVPVLIFLGIVYGAAMLLLGYTA